MLPEEPSSHLSRQYILLSGGWHVSCKLSIVTTIALGADKNGQTANLQPSRDSGTVLGGLWVQNVAAADNVTFVTDFGFNGRHAYYYVAFDKGYYKAAGLDVKIVRGQGSTDAVKQVASGTAQIGFADSSAVIFAKANDNIPIKLVAVIYAKPPHAIYVLKGSGITKPKDLEGKKLADTAFSAMPKMFGAYAKAAGIDASKVTWVVAGSDALPGMLALGRVDGIGQYTVGEPLLKKAAAPNDVVQPAYSDVGLDYYASASSPMESTLQSNPDMAGASSPRRCTG